MTQEYVKFVLIGVIRVTEPQIPTVSPAKILRLLKLDIAPVPKANLNHQEFAKTAIPDVFHVQVPLIISASSVQTYQHPQFARAQIINLIIQGYARNALNIV